MKSNRLGIGVLVGLAALTLGACNSASNSASKTSAPTTATASAEYATAADTAAAVADSPAAKSTGDSLASGGIAVTPPANPDGTAGRKIIRTADIELKVSNAITGSRRAEQLVVSHGGFLAGQQGTFDGGGDLVMTFRVPSSQFDATLSGLSGLGRVRSSRIGSTEVTGQVVDLESRLRSKRASADRLRQMLGSAQKPADLIDIERELSSREAEIESMQGQLNGLNDQVSLSTISAHIFTAPVIPRTEPKSRPTFIRGLRSGAHTLAAIGAAVAAATGVMLPFLPLGAAFGGLVLVLQRRRRRGAAV